MPAKSVTLSEHDELLIEHSLRSGRFASASEVVSEGLRLLEERDADEEENTARLRAAAAEAFAKLDRGEGIVLRHEAVSELVQGALKDARARSRIAHA